MTTTMIDASRRKGAYTVYADWSTNDPNKRVSVVVHVGTTTISGPNSEWLTDERASVGCSQSTGGNAYLANAGTPNQISDNDIPVTTYSASARTLMNQDIDQIDEFLFNLLVPEGDFVGHYVRRGILGGWVRIDKLVLPVGQRIPDTAVSHIQSFTASKHLNALALLKPSNSLVTFEYNPGTGDHQAIPVGTEGGFINGTPALVQTDQELFHLLVPLLDPDNAQLIIHQIHKNDTTQGDWQTVAELPRLQPGNSVVSIALTQADGLGGLKAVVQVRSSQGPDFLASYQSDQNFQWQGPFDLPVNGSEQHNKTISNVAGSPGLVQSIFGNQEQLDLMVPIADERTGTVTLTQFTQPAGAGSSIDHAWNQVATLLPLDGDPHTKVVSTSLIQDSNRDLQNIAHVIVPDGRALLAFYLFDPKTGWSKPTPVTKPDGQPIIVGQDNGPSNGN